MLRPPPSIVSESSGSTSVTTPVFKMPQIVTKVKQTWTGKEVQEEKEDTLMKVNQQRKIYLMSPLKAWKKLRFRMKKLLRQQNKKRKPWRTRPKDINIPLNHETAMHRID